MAYLRHDEYGIKDISEDKPDPEEYELGLNSRSFGEDHLITPQLPKLPPWAKYIWDNVTVTPFGRLKAGNLIDAMVCYPYMVNTLKSEADESEVEAHSVIAQSLYIRKTLDRDDISDLGDFDLLSYLKKMMAYRAKIAIAKNIIGAESTNPISQEALRPITSYIAESPVSSDDVYDFTGNEALFISIADYKTLIEAISSNSFVSKDQVAFMYGVKDVVLAPVSEPVIFDVSKYYLGFPKGSDGEIFEDFNMDKNTKEVLYEIKVCGLSIGKAFTIDLE